MYSPCWRERWVGGWVGGGNVYRGLGRPDHVIALLERGGWVGGW